MGILIKGEYKLQLVYFWVEEYGILKEQGVNLNSGFYFKMIKDDKGYILERKEEKEKKITKFFFGEGIKNISCIVGENGSGKTTLINAMFQQKHSKNKNSFFKYISVFEKNDKLFVYKSFNEVKISFENEELKNNEFDNFEYIYFNSEIFSTIFLGITNLKDISRGSEIYKTSLISNRKSRIYGDEILSEAKRKNKIKIVMFLLENKSIIENIPYKNLKEKFEYEFRTKKLYLKLKKQNREVYKYFSLIELEENIEIFNDTSIEKLFQKNLIKNLWTYVCEKLAKNENLIVKLKQRKEKNLENWFIENLEIIKQEEWKKISEKGEGFYEETFMNKDEISEILEILKLLEKKTNQITILSETELEISIEESKELLEILLRRNRQVMKEIFEYNLRIGFSSGENLFLTFLMEIINSNKVENSKDIIFFLEELESFMHPEWQRKLIHLLNNLKKLVPWMKNKNIQFILTSHTPFLIGDIPGGNISYFKEGKIMRNEYETFGGNIYNILKEQFLMESCFGEFSKEKIKEVVSLLSKDENNNYKEIEIENNKEEIEFVIDLIGENLVKNRLKKMYDDYKNFKIKDKTYNDLEFEKYLKEMGITKKDIIKILEEKKNDKNSNI